MALPDFTDSLTAGLLIMVVAGMIKNAIDVRGLTVQLSDLSKRIDRLAKTMVRKPD